MRAMIVNRPGKGSICASGEAPMPVPGDREVLVRIAYSCANWSDVQKRQGIYPDRVEYPLIPGCEASGTIEDLGRNVPGLSRGQRVAVIIAPRNCGGFAEFCTVGCNYVIPLADAMPLTLGAAFPVVSMTAWHLINTAYALRSGESMLIHAAAGGVGLMLTQMALAKGATVYGTVSSADKATAVLGLGAHAVIDRSKTDFVAEVLSLTDGRGVDLIIDSIGADVLDKSFDAVRPFGHIINIGEAAGYPRFDLRAAMYRRSSSLAGYELLHAIAHSTRHREGVAEVMEGLTSGRLKLPVAHVFPFEQANEMLNCLEARQISGKLLLEVFPPSEAGISG